MKGYSRTRLEQIAVEFASVCRNELFKNNPNEPIMVLSVLDSVTNKVIEADFIKDLNEDRLREYDWAEFFNVMMEGALESISDAKAPVPVSSSTATSEGRHSPSKKESEWAGKVAIAIKRNKMEKVRKLLDLGPPSESIFRIEIAFQAEQPSVPEDGEEEQKESIRGFFGLDEYERQLLFSLYPPLRRSEIERLGYPRLVSAVICWFFLRDSFTGSLTLPQTEERDILATVAVDDIAADLRSLAMSGIGFCDDEDMY